MRCKECGWTPDDDVPKEAETRVMLDHYEEEHPEVLE